VHSGSAIRRDPSYILVVMLSALIAGLFGCIIGSFLNVAVMRRHVMTLGGRSRCMSCTRTIAWYDNIPVLSWALLGGRCRWCKSHISAQYPIVEVVTAVLFALLVYAWESTTPAQLVLLGIYLTITALLVAIAVYDLRHTIIPDAWVWTFNALALLSVVLFPYLLADALYAYVAGPIAALPLFALWFVSGGRWMGLGDAKLALGIGWLLGPVYGILAIFSAFVIGAVVSVCVLLPLPYIMRLFVRTGIARSGAAQSYTMKSEVPFGPFLIAAMFFVWFALLYHIPVPILWIY